MVIAAIQGLSKQNNFSRYFLLSPASGCAFLLSPFLLRVANQITQPSALYQRN